MTLEIFFCTKLAIYRWQPLPFATMASFGGTLVTGWRMSMV
jgi:hypothetical protein